MVVVKSGQQLEGTCPRSRYLGEWRPARERPVAERILDRWSDSFRGSSIDVDVTTLPGRRRWRGWV
eukprot:2218160-Rhodomonas_salina.2